MTKSTKYHWWECERWIPSGKGLELSCSVGPYYDIRCRISGSYTLPETIRILFTNYGVCGNCGRKEASELVPCECGESGLLVDGYTYYWVSLTGIDLDTQYEHFCTARKEVKKLYDREKDMRRRERERAAEGFHTDDQIIAVWHMQEGRCYYCGDSLGYPGSEKAFQKDHIISLDAMGTHWIENIALTCARCNSSKCALDEKAFRKELAKIIGVDRVEKRAKEVANHKIHKRKLRT